jgi:hypothetical protein
LVRIWVTGPFAGNVHFPQFYYGNN